MPPQNSSAASVRGHDQALAGVQPIGKDDFCHAITVDIRHHRRTRARQAPLLDWKFSATRWWSQRDNVVVGALEHDNRFPARCDRGRNQGTGLAGADFSVRHSLAFESNHSRGGIPRPPKTGEFRGRLPETDQHFVGSVAIHIGAGANLGARARRQFK